MISLSNQRRATSRLVGENGLYVGGGMEEMTGSPGSSNSGDVVSPQHAFLPHLACALTFRFLKCVESISSAGPGRLAGFLTVNSSGGFKGPVGQIWLRPNECSRQKPDV